MKTRNLRLVLALGAAFATGTTAWGQQSYYTGYFGFGDSLSDTGRVLRETGFNGPALVGPLAFGAPGIFDTRIGLWSNAPNFLQVVPGLVGVAYNPANHYAVGGAVSGRQPPGALTSPFYPYGLQDQIDQFAARGGRLGPADLTNIWIGYNDFTFGTAAQAALANTATAINRLAGLGGREFVVFNQSTFRTGAELDKALEYNARLPGTLAPISQSGINIRLFDLQALDARMRANPTQFGFLPEAGTVACSQVSSCAQSGAANGQEDRYISPEGIHFTGRANGWIAQFLANQLNAPLTIPAQARLGEIAGRNFSTGLLDRFDALRRLNSGTTVQASYTADLPGRTGAVTTVPGPVGGLWSVFAYGTYSGGDVDARRGADGHSHDLGAGTIGLEYRVNRNLLVGTALNYARTDADMRGRGGGSIGLDSIQGALFASLSQENFFADGALTYGRNSYELSRPGVFDALRASPDGSSFTVAGRLGYLFDIGTIKLGPIAGLSYANVRIDAYRETGDTLLTIGVRDQKLEGLTASAGVQLRTSWLAGGFLVSSYINLTAEHDVRGGSRLLETFQTYAPQLVIRTMTGRDGSETYGKVAGGVSVDFARNMSVFATASSTFARDSGNSYGVNAGVNYRF